MTHQSQLLQLSVDLANKCEPESCAHGYTYVVNFFYTTNRKPNHIIVFMCKVFGAKFLVQSLQTAVIDIVVWALRVPILQGQRKPLHMTAHVRS